MEITTHVLEHTDTIRIRAMDELGLIKLVDGSIFSTISSMSWAACPYC